MGTGGSKDEWLGYDHQLLSQKKKRTVALPDSAEEGTTPIYRALSAEKEFGGNLKQGDTEITNGWVAFKESAKKEKEWNCFGYRPFTAAKDGDGDGSSESKEEPDYGDLTERGKYQWDSYGTCLTEILAVGNGLRAMGVETDANVGIFSKNRPEWMISHLANWSQSFRTVSFYDTLGAQAVEYIVGQAKTEVVFAEKDKLDKLLTAIEATKAKMAAAEASNDDDKKDEDGKESEKIELCLKTIVQFDYKERYGNLHERVSPRDKARAKELGVELIGLSEVQAKGEGKTDDVPPSPDTIAYIMYTSGTTGNPKGVIITHRAFACVIGSVYRLQPPGKILFGKNDLHVSFLPLAHSFEAAIITCILSQNGQVAFWQGDVRKISLDWIELKPTLMFGVPRVYNKTYDKVNFRANQGGAVKKWVFNRATAKSTRALRRGGRSKVFDGAVWNKVAAQAGWDNVHFLASGAAPLPPHVAEFLRLVCAKAMVVQGYGMTETCAVSFVTEPDDLTLGHVGVPVDNIEFRLVDAPECNYSVKDEVDGRPMPRGEVQMRGPTIMAGYYRNEKATKSTILDDGWLATGDIGRINPNGTLSIIDRRKNMFKTSMGEYIASEKVEAVYGKSPSVGQIWIYGNSFKSFILSVIVPDVSWTMQFFEQKEKWPASAALLDVAGTEFQELFNQICQENMDLLKPAMVAHLRAVEADSDLKKFEKIKDIHVETKIDALWQGFNVDNNCLTPTFKKKRPQLLARYKDVLKKLYGENGEAPKETENW